MVKNLLLLPIIALIFFTPYSFAQTTQTSAQQQSIMSCFTSQGGQQSQQNKAACVDAYITNISNSPSNSNSAMNILIALYQNNQSSGNNANAGQAGGPGLRTTRGGPAPTPTVITPGQVQPQEAPPVIVPAQPQTAPQQQQPKSRGIQFY